MKLTFDQIKAVTFGAVSMELHDDGIHFFKCTKKQLDGWYSLHESLGDRALTTTGVRLDFHTDATTAAFTVDSVGKGTGAKFEILVNDVTELCEYLPTDDGAHTFTMALPAGENRVTFVMPSHNVVGTLREVELVDATKCEPHKFDTKIIFMGDSITQGWNAKYDSMSYAYRVARFFNADCIIHGVGGGMYDKVTFDKVEGFDPEIVTIAMGTNDFGYYKTLEDFSAACDGHLAAIAQAYPDKIRICMTPVRRIDEDKPKALGTFRQLRDVIEATAAKYGFILVDGYNTMPYNSDFFNDGVHPTTLGFSIMADKMIAAIVKARK